MRFFFGRQKRELTSLVLYFPQDGFTRDTVQDSCLLCNTGLALHKSEKGEGRDEGQPLPAGAWSHYGMYEADDGGNKGGGSEV